MTNNNLNSTNKTKVIKDIRNILQKINVPEEGINTIIKNKESKSNVLDLIKYYTSVHDKWIFYLKLLKKEKNNKKTTSSSSGIPHPPTPPPLPTGSKINKKKFPKIEGNDFHNTRTAYENIMFKASEKKKCKIKEINRKKCISFSEIKHANGSTNIDQSKQKCEEENCCWEVTSDISIPNCYKKKTLISNNNNSKKNKKLNKNVKFNGVISEFKLKILIKNIIKGDIDYKKILTNDDSQNGSINSDIDNIKNEYKVNKNIIKFIEKNYPKIFEKFNEYISQSGGKNKRLSPKYPAKQYKLNKKMKGLDGNYWIVKERKDKRKYWKKFF